MADGQRRRRGVVVNASPRLPRVFTAVGNHLALAILYATLACFFLFPVFGVVQLWDIWARWDESGRPDLGFVDGLNVAALLGATIYVGAFVIHELWRLATEANSLKMPFGLLGFVEVVWPPRQGLTCYRAVDGWGFSADLRLSPGWLLSVGLGSMRGSGDRVRVRDLRAEKQARLARIDAELRRIDELGEQGRLSFNDGGPSDG